MIIHLIVPQANKGDRDEILHRLSFYQPVFPITTIVEDKTITIPMCLSSDPVLIFGPRSKLVDWLTFVRPGTFDVDFHTNPLDGWEWTALADYLDPEPIDLASSRHRLISRVTALKTEKKKRCYIFGTGPSLEKAIERQWEDGYRIVCNTIVRDPELWNHLVPDFIVAGDAIYHFGFTSFARAFRRDLRERLSNSDTMFVYPSKFHPIVRRDFTGLEEQLIPIPTGWHRHVNVDLIRSFELPNVGNVLGLLLFPVACTLSKQVYLWGFDGRAPNDVLFWSNSSKHSYPEFVGDLQKAHPRFFDHYAPSYDPNKYVRTYHGDLLELCMQTAEKSGWHFVMMHPSWTPTLQKRYQGAV